LAFLRPSATGRWPAVRAWLPPAFLILLGVAAFLIGLNNLFIPTAAQADSVAALAGREYLEQLANFDRNPLLIKVHVAIGTAFTVLAALQFWRRFRNGDLRRHRILGYVALACLVVLPVTGLACAIVYPFAGPAGVPPNIVWMVAILTCVVAAWRAIRRRDIFAHEAWVARATAMTVGISLSRLYEPALFHLFHMAPHTALAVSFWLGQGEGLIAAEFWLRRPGGPLNRRRPVRATARA
jgi:uncharacterized membrane protein